MRPWLAVVLVACGSTPRPTSTPAAPARAFACDAATWQADAHVEQRGRLATTGRVVNAVEVDHDEVLLASISDGVIVARWFPATALGAVTTEPVLLSPTPGAPGDRAIRVRAGAAVPATGTGDLALHARRRVTVDGFVPARMRGRVWTAAAEPSWGLAHGDYIVRAAPDASAPIRARLHDAFVRVRGGTPTWREVTAGDESIEVDGFIERPPPVSSEVYDGAEEMAPRSQVAIGTCLLDAPNGHAAGMVLSYVARAPDAASAGWDALRVDTAWGPRDYFFPTPPPAAPESDTFSWPFTGETW